MGQLEYSQSSFGGRTASELVPVPEGMENLLKGLAEAKNLGDMFAIYGSKTRIAERKFILDYIEQVAEKANFAEVVRQDLQMERESLEKKTEEKISSAARKVLMNKNKGGKDGGMAMGN